MRRVSQSRMPLLAILAVALAVRLAGIGYESLTMDEVTELRLSTFAVPAIVAEADGFPPLYQLLLRGWIAVVGTRDESARWLSALLGTFAVYATYLLARELGGERVARVAAGLAAVSPLHVWFSQEARAYPLTLLLATVAMWRFVRALRTNTRRDWQTYAVVAALGLYAHYYLGLLVALHAVWALATLARERRPLAEAIRAHVTLAVLALPAVVLLRGDLAFQSGTGEGVSLGELPFTVYAFLVGFSGGVSLRELHGASLAAAARSAAPWILALALAAALVLPGALRALRDYPRALGYLAVMGTAPLLACGLFALTLHLKYKVQYVLWASPPLLVAMALAATLDRHRLRVALAGALYVTLVVTALANRHLVERYRNEDVRAVALDLEQHSAPREPVLVSAGYMSEPLAHYLGGDWAVRGVPDADESTESAMALIDETRPPFWFVYTRPFHGDPHGRVRAYVLARPDARLAARFAGVDLYRVGPS